MSLKLKINSRTTKNPNLIDAELGFIYDFDADIL